MKLSLLKYYLIFLLILPFTFSLNYYKFEFVNTSGNYVTDAITRGFLCGDIDCKNQYVGNLWEGLSKSSNEALPNYDFILPFPASSETGSNTKAFIFFIII
jgi:hypothetical protein